MEGKTYFEILAEHDGDARDGYAEEQSAKDLLVEHTEFQEEVGPEDKQPDEIDEQHSFNVFGGSHQEASHSKVSKDTFLKTKQHVGYDKHVRVHVLSIDSRFRDDISQSSTNFTYKFNATMKNIISVRVSDIEIPNTNFTFSASRGNTSFAVKGPGTSVYRLLTITDGNYDQLGLEAELNRVFTLVYPSGSADGGSRIVAAYNDSSGRMTISTIDGTKFNMAFSLEQFAARVRDFGLGHNLGFRETTLIGKNSYTGAGLVDVIDNNYVFLDLNPDWKVVSHRTPDKNHIYSFAKIIINQPKGAVVYDTGLDTVTREYIFKQPSNISSIPVAVRDPYGQIVDLEGMDFSFTVELTEVLNAGLYETIRES